MLLHLSNAWICLVAWVVQIWIYPGFKNYSKDQFLNRQRIYFPIAVFCTLPPMMVQAYGHSIELWTFFSFLQLTQWIAVLLTWIITFFYAIPLHVQFRRVGNKTDLNIKLIRIHWIRTIAWTFILIIDFIKY